MKGWTKNIERLWIPVYTGMTNCRPGGQSADSRTVDLMGNEGRKGQKSLTQSVKREKYSIEIKDPRRILLNEKGQRR
jgi:hypothetical protein